MQKKQCVNDLFGSDYILSDKYCKRERFKESVFCGNDRDQGRSLSGDGDVWRGAGK